MTKKKDDKEKKKQEKAKAKAIAKTTKKQSVYVVGGTIYVRILQHIVTPNHLRGEKMTNGRIKQIRSMPSRRFLPGPQFLGNGDIKRLGLRIGVDYDFMPNPNAPKSKPVKTDADDKGKDIKSIETDREIKTGKTVTR